MDATHGLLISLLAVVATFTALTMLSPCVARVADEPAANEVVLGDVLLGDVHRDGPACPASPAYAGVRIAERRVNSIEAMASTPTCFAESDFMLTADDHLVATHDAAMGGDCGDVNQQTLEGIRRCRLAGGLRVATLDDFLAVPLTEWYVDLKSNLIAATDAEILHSVEVAVRSITRQGRERGAVLLVYQVTPAVVDVLRDNGIRAGLKGYPDSRRVGEGDGAGRPSPRLRARLHQDLLRRQADAAPTRGRGVCGSSAGSWVSAPLGSGPGWPTAASGGC